MGALIVKLKRPLNRFNIENRANAVLSRSKPIPAPKPAASIKQLQLAQELNPGFLKDHYAKNLKLDENLKNVYVTSTESETNTLNQPNPDRPLPLSRVTEDLEFGFYLPDSVPIGKITLKDLFQLIISYKDDSVKNNFDNLAKQYKLDKETVEKLIEYYKLYQLIIPERFSIKSAIKKLGEEEFGNFKNNQKQLDSLYKLVKNKKE